MKTWAWELYPTPNILPCGNQRIGTKIPRWRVVILCGTKIPETLRSVVVEKIDSLGQLEVLILLIHHSGKNFDASAVSAHLKSNQTSAASQLKRLCDAKLISCSEGGLKTYFFSPSNEILAQVAKDLPYYYPRFQQRFIELIYNKPRERIQALVDSFKISGGKKDG